MIDERAQKKKKKKGIEDTMMTKILFRMQLWIKNSYKR